ncbi:MAG: hypothetical protein MZU95_09025 [Desulfomicrobium escambiense]|nr:hypothetical protein [Desulfomicrobium escambiense]
MQVTGHHRGRLRMRQAGRQGPARDHDPADHRQEGAADPGRSAPGQVADAIIKEARASS